MFQRKRLETGLHQYKYERERDYNYIFFMAEQTNRACQQGQAAEKARDKNRIKDLVSGVEDFFQGRPRSPAA
jgi:hypothetical protein